jgi:hypothetical protein
VLENKPSNATAKAFWSQKASHGFLPDKLKLGVFLSFVNKKFLFATIFIVKNINYKSANFARSATSHCWPFPSSSGRREDFWDAVAINAAR